MPASMPPRTSSETQNVGRVPQPAHSREPAGWRTRPTSGAGRRLPLLFAEPFDLEVEELMQRRFLLRRDRRELNGRAEHVLRVLLAAPHLHDGAQDLTGDVEAAVTREDQCAWCAWAHGRSMNDRGAAQTE